MKYVLDSSVAFKWLVPEADTPKALRLRDEFNKTLLELIAPDVFPVETTHALTRAERQNRTSAAAGHCGGPLATLDTRPPVGVTPQATEADVLSFPPPFHVPSLPKTALLLPAPHVINAPLYVHCILAPPVLYRRRCRTAWLTARG